MGRKILKRKITYKGRTMIEQEILEFLQEKGIAFDSEMQSTNTFEQKAIRFFATPYIERVAA